MESACSLSSTQRIVLFGRILAPGIFLPMNRPAQGDHRHQIFLDWVKSYLNSKGDGILGPRRRTCKVPKLPTSGKLCGRFQPGRIRRRKARGINRLLHRADQKKISPRTTSTACPPTRTLTILSPSRSALRKILLRRFISTPCSSSACSPEPTTPYFTAQAAHGPAAEPVACSSPL